MHDYEIIANDPEVDIVVEVMGGIEPAYTFVKRALESGECVRAQFSAGSEKLNGHAVRSQSLRQAAVVEFRSFEHLTDLPENL